MLCAAVRMKRACMAHEIRPRLRSRLRNGHFLLTLFKRRFSARFQRQLWCGMKAMSFRGHVFQTVSRVVYRRPPPSTGLRPPDLPDEQHGVLSSAAVWWPFYCRVSKMVPNRGGGLVWEILGAMLARCLGTGRAVLHKNGPEIKTACASPSIASTTVSWNVGS
jgi:hypothetical protein